MGKCDYPPRHHPSASEVEDERLAGDGAHGVASDDGVVDEGVGLGDVGENELRISHVWRGRGGNCDDEVACGEGV